jgi:tRNA(fMet)-specific endonuclease VapC
MRYLLDTDTCSHIMRAGSSAINSAIWNRLDKLEERSVAISVITLGELQFGTALKPLATRIATQLVTLLRYLHVAPLNPDTCLHYGRIRSALQVKGTPIGPNDLWIAAHALALGLTLVTNNTREFKRVAGLKLESWV